jgi:hypothetical protein
MRVISWVLTAQDLLDAWDALTKGRDGDLARIRRSASTIAMLAETNLATVPEEPETHDGDGDGAESLWWQGIRARLRRFTGDADALVDTVIRDMGDRLGGILDVYGSDAAEFDDGHAFESHSG